MIAMTDRTKAIDISHHNGEWDLTRMPDDVWLVMHKATEGSTFVDKRYLDNRRKAREWIYKGGVWGAYHVFRETSEPGAQASHFLDVVHQDHFDYLALDLETRHIKALIDQKHSAERARGWILEWLVRIGDATGVQPLVYVSERGIKHLTARYREELGVIGKYPLWLADYKHDEITLPKTHDTWAMWQWTSDGKGPDYGLESEHVDLNWINPEHPLWGDKPTPPAPTDEINKWLVVIEDAVAQIRALLVVLLALICSACVEDAETVEPTTLVVEQPSTQVCALELDFESDGQPDIVEHTFYDSVGRVVREEKDHGADGLVDLVIQYAYDHHGRLVTVESAEFQGASWTQTLFYECEQ